MKIIPEAKGIFYPAEKDKLLGMFESIEIEHMPSKNLIIVPHAGYEYTAKMLIAAYSYIDANISQIIIIAPAIYNSVYGIVSGDADAFETPFGDLNCVPFPSDIDNKILSEESALTVQLPVIKYMFPKASIVPIVYGCEDYKNISKIIEDKIRDSAIVVVSNLSRFIPERQCNRLDEHTSWLINNKHIGDFDIELADGAVGICGVLNYIKDKDLRLVELVRSNSSKVNGDTSNVVGYGSWVLTTQ